LKSSGDRPTSLARNNINFCWICIPPKLPACTYTTTTTSRMRRRRRRRRRFDRMLNSCLAEEGRKQTFAGYASMAKLI
jgi:hypothetical protein